MIPLAVPSLALAEIVGSSPASHAEVMTQLLLYIDEHGLREAEDELSFRCDPKLQELFHHKRMTVVDLEWRVVDHMTLQISRELPC